MKRVAVRIPNQLWKGIAWYAGIAGLIRADGVVDVSETLRDLLARGLVTDRSGESGYRSGYAAGRSAGYRDFMRGLAAASTSASPNANAASVKGNGR